MWCRRGDSNPHGFPSDFESGASTNSATSAFYAYSVAAGVYHLFGISARGARITLMAYTDFTIDDLKEQFGLQVRGGAMFEGVKPMPAPQHLPQRLNIRGVPLRSEKARSEVIIMPILLAILERNTDRLIPSCVNQSCILTD
jgi:hypothetical protein